MGIGMEEFHSVKLAIWPQRLLEEKLLRIFETNQQRPSVLLVDRKDK